MKRNREKGIGTYHFPLPFSLIPARLLLSFYSLLPLIQFITVTECQCEMRTQSVSSKPPDTLMATPWNESSIFWFASLFSMTFYLYLSSCSSLSGQRMGDCSPSLSPSFCVGSSHALYIWSFRLFLLHFCQRRHYLATPLQESIKYFHLRAWAVSASFPSLHSQSIRMHLAPLL